MSGLRSRRKGMTEEQVIVRLLAFHGWLDAARQLDQSAEGGGDIVFGGGAYLLEAKVRAKTITLGERDGWWTKLQGDALCCVPKPAHVILTFRTNGRSARMARFHAHLIPGVDQRVRRHWVEAPFEWLLEHVLYERLQLT